MAECAHKDLGGGSLPFLPLSSGSWLCHSGLPNWGHLPRGLLQSRLNKSWPSPSAPTKLPWLQPTALGQDVPAASSSSQLPACPLPPARGVQGDLGLVSKALQEAVGPPGGPGLGTCSTGLSPGSNSFPTCCENGGGSLDQSARVPSSTRAGRDLSPSLGKSQEVAQSQMVWRAKSDRNEEITFMSDSFSLWVILWGTNETELTHGSVGSILFPRQNLSQTPVPARALPLGLD